MVLTRFELIMGLLAALATGLGTLALGLRWIYKQGAASAELNGAVDQNARETAKLTQAFEEFRSKTDGLLIEHTTQLAHHDERLTAVEGQLDRVEGRLSPRRLGRGRLPRLRGSHRAHVVGHGPAHRESQRR